MYVFLNECDVAYTMVDFDVNVNAAMAKQVPAMHHPRSSQSNPIYKIDVDILKNTNFFRAFTASSTIPSIYIQQFWDTIRYDNKTGNYSCQLDEQWFNLTQDTLRDALQITPVDTNNAFSSPPTPDALIKNPVKEILLKMNLPDHRSVLTDPEVHVKMEMEIPRSSGVNSQPHVHT
ncbi:hypothetical protein Tco_0261434 [Tanacetum coccineum]